VCFAIDDVAWRKWSNIHPWLMRHGICLADLGLDQREAALCLLRETMSASGYQGARDIMKLNEHALEITGKAEEYGEWFYWVSIFGTPESSRWAGWRSGLLDHPRRASRGVGRSTATTSLSTASYWATGW
jgi:hypothetical protein